MESKKQRVEPEAELETEKSLDPGVFKMFQERTERQQIVAWKWVLGGVVRRACG